MTRLDNSLGIHIRGSGSYSVERVSLEGIDSTPIIGKRRAKVYDPKYKGVGVRAKPRLSAACKKGLHYSCIVKLCTCDCGHKI